MVANMTGEQADHGSTVRALIRAGRRASLATLLPEEGAAPGPYVSLVMIAADLDASPLLLLSDLALHARNLATDPRAALLFDGTEGLAEPLAGERATVTGRVERVASEGLRARYLRYHPDAARYAAFADFALYRMRVTGAHLVAGFGRIASVPAAAPRAWARSWRPSDCSRASSSRSAPSTAARRCAASAGSSTAAAGTLAMRPKPATRCAPVTRIR